jgi:hypothetical protein
VDDAGKHSHHQAHPPVPVAWPAVACGPLAAGAAGTTAAETVEARLRRSAPTTKRCGSTRRLTRTQLRLQFMARWPKAAWPRWPAWSLFVSHGGVRGRCFCGGDGSGECARGARHDEAVHGGAEEGHRVPGQVAAMDLCSAGNGDSGRVRARRSQAKPREMAEGASEEVDMLWYCSVLPNARGGEDARKRSGGVMLAWSPRA